MKTNYLTAQQRIALWEAFTASGLKTESEFELVLAMAIQANDEARREAGWLVEPPRPIEEAPKDDTEVLLKTGKGGVVLASWCHPMDDEDLDKCWCVEDNRTACYSYSFWGDEPTHFYNLPSGQITPNNTDNLGILTEREESVSELQ